MRNDGDEWPEKAGTLAQRFCITFSLSLFYGMMLFFPLNWFVPIPRDSYIFYYIALALSPIAWWYSGVFLRKMEEREEMIAAGIEPFSLTRYTLRKLRAVLSHLFGAR